MYTSSNENNWKKTSGDLIAANNRQKKIFNVYLFLREKERDRDRVCVGEGQREGERESEAGSRLQAVSTEPGAGLEPTYHEIMS